jgi:L-threonylcarbamoyladenylate synthase
VDARVPDAPTLARAAAVLRAGGLVAFPTETVYGLGAHALDAAAVARIFAAKGRPATNPLIVHVADESAARALVTVWPASASALAERFWPGPLTLVVPRGAMVPELVTAGGPTVALRVPAHPVARELLHACGFPIAAPSANRSNQLSPTCAGHVLQGIGERIDLLLDSGPCPGGLESTVLDLTTLPPRLLRPGLIAPAAIEALVGPIERLPVPADTAPARSPGLLARHYAPRTPLDLIVGNGRDRVEALTRQGLRVGWVTFDSAPVRPAVIMPSEPLAYQTRLYAALHALDDQGCDRIVLELPPDTDPWLAVHDRLRRAAMR